MQNDVSGDVRDNGTVVQVHHVNGDILLHNGSARRQRIIAARTAVVVRTLLALVLVGGEQYAFSVLADNVFPEGERIRPSGLRTPSGGTWSATRGRACEFGGTATGSSSAAPRS